MILKKLFIYSFKELSVLKEYTFNTLGLNIILGEKKDEHDEANGVGKTTMVECISFLLGKEIHKYYTDNPILINKEIFLVLEVNSNGRTMFLGRHINTPEKGYVLFDNKINYNLSEWKLYDDTDYKNFIHNEILGEETTDISFAAVRDYIMRDEQDGFTKNNLGIAKRAVVYQSKALAFLCGLPYNSEIEIKKITNEISKLKDEKSALMTSIGESVSSLKSRKTKCLNEIKKIEKDINQININKQYNIKVSDYNTNKEKLNKIQKDIFKLQHIKKQYERNIENLEKKVEDIKQLNDIEPFYKELLGLFPEKIHYNYEKVKDFYDFMVQNRGKYFYDKIDKISNEIVKLERNKKEIEETLKDDYKIFKSINLIEDINSIVAEREKFNMQLAEINLQLNNHKRSSILTTEINTLKSKKLLLTQRKNDEFNAFNEHISQIEECFQELSEIAYNTAGVLNIQFDSNVNERNNSTTGRVKIQCELPDDRSHGINYMKINMFDLSWFLTSLSNNLPKIKFLFHDGSYSKPNPAVKGKILKHVDSVLNNLGKGQYFVTINKNEILTEDFTHFDKENKFIARLDREDNNQNRFFGFKLYTN
ncbi:DUF2326 domain-containing protein [Bacillus cereus]|uniref:DUF2326 domain-containing protein n=1 Tax=Bacillus cereus TaxID=1396 RepID=UPI001FFD4A4B|nr:DUF2326 domain-containing protein [Bacillus cereus]UPJ18594.1 DUF2326 domain-containing protein [Bacillus cereus]